MLIRKQLTERARDFNIILDDVAITELRLHFKVKYVCFIIPRLTQYYFPALDVNMRLLLKQNRFDLMRNWLFFICDITTF